MKNKFIVSSEYTKDGKSALFLDRARTKGEWYTTKIKVGNKSYDYQLAYNDSIIIIDTQEDLTGKEIEFV